MQGGAGLALLATTISTTISTALSAAVPTSTGSPTRSTATTTGKGEAAAGGAAVTSGELARLGAQLQTALDRVVATTQRLWSSGDVEVALANSSVYLEAVGHVVVAWIWLEQLLACDGRVGDFYDGKRQAGRYFFRWELPRTGAQLDLLDSLDVITLEMADRWF